MNPSVKVGKVQTDVGLTPMDWNITRIDAHCSIKTGSRNTQDKVEGGAYPFYVRSQQVERINSYSYDGEAVLTAGDGVGTGKVFHYINGKFDVHQRVYHISDFSDHLHGRYFFYQFSTRFYERIMSMTAKSSVDSVRMEMIAGMQIPLPPVHEQAAIASALDDIDALLSSLDQLIAKKRDIQQATRQQLLTGQRRLPGFNGEWEVKRLGDFANLKQGYAFKSEWYTEFGPFKVATIANVQDGWMKTNDCNRISFPPEDIQPHHILMVGEIIISMTGNVGRICKVSEEGWILNQRVGKIIPAEINPEYLFFLLSLPSFSKAMMNLAKGGAQGNLSSSDITGFELWLPTSIDEMTAIATILCDMASELASHEARRNKAIQLKQGMMQELLTGRIRLV